MAAGSKKPGKTALRGKSARAAPASKGRRRGVARDGAGCSTRRIGATQPATPNIEIEFDHEFMGLERTGAPGVYINRAGVLVDHNGVSVSFNNVQHATREQEQEVLGKYAETPAEVLKFYALDPRGSKEFRMEAANKAAPYYDKKMPIDLGGTLSVDHTVTPEKILGAMTEKELAALAPFLDKLAVRVSKLKPDEDEQD